MSKQPIQTQDAPAAIGPYSQGILANGFVFVSGQLPLNPATNAFPDGIAEQTRQSLLNLRAILRAAGISPTAAAGSSKRTRIRFCCARGILRQAHGLPNTTLPLTLRILHKSRDFA